MALKGTLKDFGIADILQLIGQQQKTGELVLKERSHAVVVRFKDGNIVSAEVASRQRKELIGSMLVAANLLTAQQLEMALETQKRTLHRLGDVLVSQGVVTAEKFRAMVQLQTSETLFKLFTWKAGTYEFEQKDVDAEDAQSALRAESVLMEGFRRVDEWPGVRKRIPSLQMTFEKLKELPPAQLAKDQFDDALDSAFQEQKKSGSKNDSPTVGDNERLVFEHIASGRTVARLIELSMLGEFETAKALSNLLNDGYVRGIASSVKGGDDFAGESRASVFVGVLGRIAGTMLVVGAILVVATRIDFGAVRLGRSNASSYADPAIQRFVSQQQLSRVAAALEVFKLENGVVPEQLDELVEAKLLSADDLHFPWREPYFYRRTPEGDYVLLPPLR